MNVVFGRINRKRQRHRLPYPLNPLNLLSLRIDLRDMNLFDTAQRIQEHGTRYRPGIPLVHLLGKTVLARTLEAWQLELREPALPPGGPLPHMLDIYAIRFGASPRGPSA